MAANARQYKKNITYNKRYFTIISTCNLKGRIRREYIRNHLKLKEMTMEASPRHRWNEVGITLEFLVQNRAINPKSNLAEVVSLNI